MRFTAVLAGASLLYVGVFAGEPKPSALSFDARVAAQKAVEQVYWNHRIWPESNPQPKPTLAAVMSDEMICARVEDYLKKSNAIETWWHRQITSRQLQAEIDRMSRESRDPATLIEIHAALGNDPVLIAETLGRPALVERMIHGLYAADERFHGALRRDVERSLAGAAGVAAMKALGGRYAERRIVRGTNREIDSQEPRKEMLELSIDEWRDWKERLARQFGKSPDRLPVRQLSTLQEDSDQFFVTAILSLDTDAAVVASVAWPKRPFDAWWSAERAAMRADVLSEAADYAIAAPALSVCANDTWDTREAQPPGRSGHTAVWTGSEMIVWGGADASGYFNVGARYNPSTNTWISTSAGANVPSARYHHTAVWTGTEMIVWGGSGRDGILATGARYNLSTDSWTPTSVGAGVPDFRAYHTAVWSGTEMIIWGGAPAGPAYNTGGRYNPSTDSWTPTSTGANVPIGVASHTAVWTGTEMIVWGGTNNSVPFTTTGGRYDPATDSWTTTSIGANVPVGRADHTAVWTGTEMIVWGGGDQSTTYNTGGRYNPSTNSWTPTSTGANVPAARTSHTAVWTGTVMIVWGGSEMATGARYVPSNDTWTSTSTGTGTPSARSRHTAVWTGSEMIVWGGETDSYFPITGGRYDPTTNAWVETGSDQSGPALRYDHSAVWTGAEMIVWGGSDGVNYVVGGSRYNPSTNSWLPTSMGANVPGIRDHHTAVWTGVEMIIWGGSTNTGGRYNPMTDAWRPTSIGSNVPSLREFHSAVWTGTEMIVWGGVDNSFVYLATGGRYKPATDSWTTTSITGVPQGRYSHTAVWTGTEMIVWGGRFYVNDLNTGGRYNPTTDAWTATGVGINVPVARIYHTAIWSGTQMIIWGGRNDNNVALQSGGRYSPSSNTWTSMTGANVPQPRIYHTALWTGSQMIVWGGRLDTGGELNSGGRYAPSTNSWLTTSTGAHVPPGRSFHTAVWTGAQMIVWGGSPLDGSTALYCACPDGILVYRDADGDGYGVAGVPVPACTGSVPAGFVTNGTDCNDTSSAIHPGVADVCNGADDDCDGTADTGGGALCDDGVLCTTDVCGGAAGCSHVNNTIACNDGNACTTNDACAGGACTGGPPLDCNDGNQCTTDGCIPAMGCSHAFATGPCDDGNVCTAGEACVSGTCGGGSPNDGIACSDGNACTVTDLCVGGSCSPGASLDCNDNNVCTDDSCNTVTGCVHANNSVSCSDGLLCTAGDVCGGGACHGTPVICNDDNACTDDACSPSTGSCFSVNDDTNACSDGNLCTQVDACQAGVCVGASPVSCGGACPPGTSQVPDGCQKVYDIGVNALDNLLAYCDGTGSNRYNNRNGPDYGFHWTDLGGGLPVTSLDVWFVSGIHCEGTTSSVKLNGLTVGSFNPPGTCTCSPPRSVISFADFPLGAYASGAQNSIRITPGGCEGLSISAALGNNYARVTVTYSALDSCRVPTCVPSTGACSYPALPDGTACTDGSACTTGDLCSGGSCTPGSPLDCVDGDDCTTDSCAPAAGCVHTAIGPPSEVGGVTLAKSADDVTIAWTLASGATSSDVLRGDIAALPVGPGGGDEVCLGSTGTTEMTDFVTLDPGSGAWYLVRGVNACAGSGPYGFEGLHGAPAALRATTTCP